MNKNYNHFIGIDVSRNKLDYAIFEGSKFLFHKERKNESDDINEFIKELKQLPKFSVSKTLIVMEYTGIYCNYLLTTLKKLKANFAQVNPLHIKKSQGLIRGKDDKIDSVRIGRYALKNFTEINIWIHRRPVVEQLSNLFTLRNRLNTTCWTLKKPLGEQLKFAEKGIFKQSLKLCENTINAIEADIVEVNKQIKRLIKSDENLNRLNEIITSVPSVGIVTSILMIISSNEFKKISDAKKFACYAGVAPFKRESGLFVGKAKVSHIANKKMKALLHMCALTSVRKQGELREFFKRKTEIEGKHKMLVLNAIRNKLILRIFACIKENRLYKETYAPLSTE